MVIVSGDPKTFARTAHVLTALEGHSLARSPVAPGLGPPHALAPHELVLHVDLQLRARPTSAFDLAAIESVRGLEWSCAAITCNSERPLDPFFDPLRVFRIAGEPCLQALPPRAFRLRRHLGVSPVIRSHQYDFACNFRA